MAKNAWEVSLFLFIAFRWHFFSNKNWISEQKLPPDEKERYKQLAKTKPTRIVVVPPKYTSQGIPLEQVDREQQALAEKKRYMERRVKNMIENAFLDNGAYNAL